MNHVGCFTFSISLPHIKRHKHSRPLIHIHLSLPSLQRSDGDIDEDDGENRQKHVKRLLANKGNKGQGCVRGATYTPDILSYCSTMDEDLDIGKDAPMISVDYKPISCIYEQLTKLKRQEEADHRSNSRSNGE